MSCLFCLYSIIADQLLRNELVTSRYFANVTILSTEIVDFVDIISVSTPEQVVKFTTSH